MSIRIIFDAKNPKVLKNYNFLKGIELFKNTKIIKYYKFDKIEKIISNSHNYKEPFLIEDKVKYNIYIDIISEVQYDKLPCEYTILIVNDKYLINDNYLRREYLIDEPLKILDNYVDYYFCLTKYSYNLLKKIIINKHKIYLMNGLLLNNNLNISILNKKYILYNIDSYSKQINVNILKVWVNYFLDRPEILIIKLKYENENIVTYICNLLNIKYLETNSFLIYKNIRFLFKNKTYINNIKNEIYASIINHDNYDLILNLYSSIINNYFILTYENKISKELLKNNAIYFNDFNENTIYNMLKTLFSYDNKYIDKCVNTNKKTLNKYIISTQKILKKIF